MSYATLESKERKARKPHKCDYCDQTIEKGEVYDWSKHVYDGDLYEWKSHKKCSLIVSEIWDYVDPDEGMSENDFSEGCQEICQRFVCPDCPEWNKEYEECEKDETYCIDRLADFFRTNELYRAGRDRWNEVWKCRPREEKT